jgi:hypothetical protein
MSQRQAPVCLCALLCAGSGSVSGDGLSKFRTINLDPAFVNRKLRCDPSGELLLLKHPCIYVQGTAVLLLVCTSVASTAAAVAAEAAQQ